MATKGYLYPSSLSLLRISGFSFHNSHWYRLSILSLKLLGLLSQQSNKEKNKNKKKLPTDGEMRATSNRR